MSGKVSASGKKKTPKQEALALRREAERLTKKAGPLWRKKQEIEAKLKELDEAKVNARTKAARLLCPFKERQILKHVWRGQYTKVCTVLATFDSPYFACYGSRCKADGSKLPGDPKRLDVDAWEPLPVKDAKK